MIRFFRRRPFSAWQVELTTRCLLRCTMCAKEGGAPWERRDMDFEAFRKISPHFRKVRRVVLEGWGESLLYPRLEDCIRVVKKQGAEAGFVTSGTGLDADRSGALLDAGLDFIGFSFSGASAKTHNAIRKGSDFDSLVESVRTLRSLSEQRGLKKPEMHIVYLMLRDNIEETGSMVRLAAQLGVRKIALVHAILISSREQDAERIFPETAQTKQKNRSCEDILKEACAEAKRAGIEMIVPALGPMEVGVCGEDPLRNLYISADGEVSPCVYLYPPVPLPFTRFHFGVEHPACRISFGNIFRQPFSEIWNSRAYSGFRRSFQERERVVQSARQAAFGDPGSFGRGEDMPEAPDTCRTCHKLSGF